MTDNAKIRSLYLPGPAGRLEALLNVGSEDAAYAALVAHPHPVFGGTMHNKVVFHAMKAFSGFGFSVLRFNFRGAGNSQGEHDQGRGEIDDVRAALDWLTSEFRKPIVFAGFSFGAAVGMQAACPDARVAAIVSLGLPVDVDGRTYRYEYLANCAKPKLFVSGSNDQFAPRQRLSEAVANASEPKRFILVPNADHFFEGHLDQLRGAVQTWVREVLLQGGAAV